MRLREVAEADKQQMMKARQQKLLEGQQVPPVPSPPQCLFHRSLDFKVS